MAARRRTAEDKNTKVLRELASLPHNKQCFDCLQRGPTYINVTIGSFVCTTCSGLLRGLTPPHRVKSISMTTFTPEEIEQLKSRGNEYCRYVWLGTFDTSSNSLENEVSDDQRKRDFMVQKYEKKRWYVDPDIAIKKLHTDQLQRQKQMPHQNYSSKSSNQVPEAQPLSQLLGKSPTPLVVQNHQHTEKWPHPVSSASAPSISTKTTIQNHGSRSIDLLSELAGETVAAPQSTQSNENFADFANFESAFSNEKKSVNTGNVPAAANLPASASLDACLSNPRSTQREPFSPPTVSSAAPSNLVQQSSGDRYAALADLDSLFHQPAKASNWTVETTSTASMFNVPASASDQNNIFSSAPSNPFTTSELFSQPMNKSQGMAHPANPFQAIPDERLTYGQPPASNQVFSPFPMVGNSPTEEPVLRNQQQQFNANFASFPPPQQATSPTNGYASQMLVTNGGFMSPTSGSASVSWAPANAVQQSWSSSHLGSGGLFGADQKPPEPVQSYDWMQNPVNPFTVPSGTFGYQTSAPRNNPSNPFL